jgi:hypothetical protein
MRRRSWSFPIELPVRYRLSDDPYWHSGVTDLLSDSQAVVKSDPLPESASKISLIVSLPSTDDDSGGCVVAQGIVRRCAVDIADWRTPWFVVDISSYSLDRLDRVLREASWPEPHAALSVSCLNLSEYRVH